MQTEFKQYLEFIEEAKKLGATEVTINKDGASVKFGPNTTDSAAIVRDMIKPHLKEQEQTDEEEDLLYWSSGG